MSIPQNVLVNVDASERLQSIISQGDFDKVTVLVDDNTLRDCWPLLDLPGIDLIQIESGEQHKTLQTCESIWQQMTDLHLSRNSLLVNLGGGVIGDMGGFAASTYKRGISFINVPTTLLAQVDASIGGKLGIDFHGLKNHIGIFQEPHTVLLDTSFLSTLGPRQLRSGFAEMLKHGLIRNKSHWEQLTSEPFTTSRDWQQLLRESVHIKGEVVAEDPRERGLRKILNFGHTLGHAVETYFLSTDKPLLHGEAIAIGMVLEAYLSTEVCGLSSQSLETITGYLLSTYGKHPLPPLDETESLMRHDKKNEQGRINFSLLRGIGDCSWDQQITGHHVKAAFDYYNNLDE